MYGKPALRRPKTLPETNENIIFGQFLDIFPIEIKVK